MTDRRLKRHYDSPRMYGISENRADMKTGLMHLTLLLTVCLAASVGWAAPIGTNTALPLSTGEIIIREQLVATHASDDFGGIGRHVDNIVALTVMGYGFTPKLALFAVLPLVNIENTFGNVSTSGSGPGDAALFARYEIFRSDEPGRTFRIAPFAGIRIPTGSEGETGDGSLDVFGGLIATLASTQWVLDSQLRHDFNRESNGFEQGDVTRLESSFQYRLSPGKVSQDTNAFIYGVLEISARYYERNRTGGVTDPNSGGFHLFLTPGLQYATRRWIADLGVTVPLIRDLNGSALEPDYAILTSIRVNF